MRRHDVICVLTAVLAALALLWFGGSAVLADSFDSWDLFNNRNPCFDSPTPPPVEPFLASFEDLSTGASRFAPPKIEPAPVGGINTTDVRVSIDAMACEQGNSSGGGVHRVRYVISGAENRTGEFVKTANTPVRQGAVCAGECRALGARWDITAEGKTTITFFITPGDSTGPSGPEFGPYPSVTVEIRRPAAVKVNDRLRLNSTTTAYNPNDTRAPAGVYRITANFTNTGADKLSSLSFLVTTLTGGNVLLSRDTGTPAGVGAKQSAPAPSLGSDGVLTSKESFNVVFEIGLHTRARFTFFVDAYGAVISGATAPLRAAAVGVSRAPAAARPAPSLGGEFTPSATGRRGR